LTYKGDREGTCSLSLKQESTSEELRTQINLLIKRVPTSKLKLPEKVKMISALTKSHEALVKAERSVAGLDKDSAVNVAVGVIVVPTKAGTDSWHADSLVEIERVKLQQKEDDLDSST